MKNNHRELTADEAFDITILAHCEVTVNILLKRTQGNDKPSKIRRNRLKTLANAVELINQTYHGYLPEAFHKNAEDFYLEIEKNINRLLLTYHGRNL